MKLQENSDYRNRGLRSKAIFYRIYRILNEPAFLSELHTPKLEFCPIDPRKNCDCLTKTFLGLVDKHACLRNKFVRENRTHFMNREFRKEICNRSKLKYYYWKQSNENKITYKKQRNKGVKIRRKNLKPI